MPHDPSRVARVDRYRPADPTMRRRVLRLSALPLLLVALLAAGPPDVLASRDFADPFVLREGTTYYAYATGTGGAHLQMATSTDLTTWTRGADPLPVLPSWSVQAGHLTWAPSVVKRDGRWVLYYTTADASSGFQCIGRAVATRPEGPFVDDSPRPLICQTVGEMRLCGSIDPSPFVDADGKLYLLWKSDENASACRAAARLWSQRLTDDGLATMGAASALVATDRPWEAPLVEGPSMWRDGGTLHLFYSANWYESASYAIGHARCDSPLGPCAKTSVDGPLVASDGATLGPGGQELFADLGGGVWMAHHAWTAPATSYGSGGARSLRLARVTFAGGMPRITAAGIARGASSSPLGAAAGAP